MEVPDFEAKAAKLSRKKIRYEVEHKEASSEPVLSGPSTTASCHTLAAPASVPSGDGDVSELHDDSMAQKEDPAPIDPNINKPPVPDEVFIKILAYLAMDDLLLGAALVCKRWNLLTEAPELWRCIDLDINQQMPPDVLLQLLRKFDGIQTLNLKGYCYVDRTIMMQIGRLSMLRGLLLDGFAVFSIPIFKSISKCKLLERLSFVHVKKLDDSALTMIAESCTNLIALELWECRNITAQGVKAVMVNCTRLTHMKLVQCSHVTSDAFLDCKQPLQLEALDISTCSGRFKLNFVHKLPKLKILYTSELNGMNDAVVSKLHNLTSLDVSHCSVTSEGFSAILRNNPALLALHLMAIPINDSDLAMMSESPCRLTLTHLSFSWCGTDVGIQSILQHCSNLRELNIDVRLCVLIILSMQTARQDGRWNFQTRGSISIRNSVVWFCSINNRKEMNQTGLV